MPKDLTTQQAAEALGVDERTIRTWIEQGAIDAYKLNPQSKSVYRIPSSEVQRIRKARADQRNQPERK